MPVLHMEKSYNYILKCGAIKCHIMEVQKSIGVPTKVKLNIPQLWPSWWGGEGVRVWHGMCHKSSPGVPDSIPTRGHFFAEFILQFPM